MMQALLIVLGTYLAACYAYGMYLAIRLFTGRRLRQTAIGAPPRRVVRPLSQSTRYPVGSPEAKARQRELDQAKAAA